jgi:hypothetical protein
MKIRDLTAADLFTLAEIAEKISADLMVQMTDEISDKKLGVTMALSILKYIPKEIKSFLALITEQTPEELDKKPFSEPLKIFKALLKKKDFTDFLQELNSIKAEISQKSQT